MSEKKCPVCGEIMIHTDLTDMDRCNNPTCGDMHVLIPPNYQTYADRLAARVAELEARELQARELQARELPKFILDQCNEIQRLTSELAAAKAEIRQLKISLGVLEMKEKVKGL
jgi:hypothetical protein